MNRSDLESIGNAIREAVRDNGITIVAVARPHGRVSSVLEFANSAPRVADAPLSIMHESDDGRRVIKVTKNH